MWDSWRLGARVLSSSEDASQVQTAMPSTKLSGVSLVTLLVCGQGWLPQILAFGLGDRRFKYEGLLDTGSGGLGSENGPIVALGDSNGDQLCVLHASCDQLQSAEPPPTNIARMCLYSVPISAPSACTCGTMVR